MCLKGAAKLTATSCPPRRRSRWRPSLIVPRSSRGTCLVHRRPTRGRFPHGALNPIGARNEEVAPLRDAVENSVVDHQPPTTLYRVVVPRGLRGERWRAPTLEPFLSCPRSAASWIAFSTHSAPRRLRWSSPTRTGGPQVISRCLKARADIRGVSGVQQHPEPPHTTQRSKSLSLSDARCP